MLGFRGFDVRNRKREILTAHPAYNEPRHAISSRIGVLV